MAYDQNYGTRLPSWSDRSGRGGIRYDSASYIGIVKDNKDPARSGRLKVWIPDHGGIEDRDWQTISYASPYFGSTYQPDTNTNNNFQGVNHTYGMWMVPPDIGNMVLCTFVNGNPDRGYWFACINPTLSHYMVPGMAAGNKIDKATASEELKKSLLEEDANPPQSLPVVEFNEYNEGSISGEFYNNPKPIHEFQANILFRQGLDRDNTRGAISSSSQRESPSHVFGISTPGRSLNTDPADDPEYENKLNSGTVDDAQFAVPTRKGGHTFVMDDGDQSGKNQAIRLRSAGGHQILMNDDQNVFYIANRDGSTWIELSANGHLNIYSAGGFNVRTEGDLNLHSDKNLNINGASVNISSEGSLQVSASDINLAGAQSTTFYGGQMKIGGGSLSLTGDSVLLGGGGVKISGSTVDINKNGSGNAVQGGKIVTNSHADASYDDQTRLWSSVPSSKDSIVTVLPAHEPWERSGTPAATTKITTSSICPPKYGSTPADYTLPPPNGNTLDRGLFRGKPAPWTTDVAFLDAVKSISGQLGFNSYLELLAAMYLESAFTMDPAIYGGDGKHFVGLIQFGPPAAKEVGFTQAQLAQMTRPEQTSGPVLKYMLARKKEYRITTFRLCDVYSMINWPATTGQDLTTVCYSGTNGLPNGRKTIWKDEIIAYNANKSLDIGNKGYVTMQDFQTFMELRLRQVKQALANSGVTANNTQTVPRTTGNDGATSSGSSTPATNGRGTEVKKSESSATKDKGIVDAAGKALVPPVASSDLLGKTDTYSPPGEVGTAPKLTQSQVRALMCELGFFESRFDYTAVNTDKKRIGKYQVDAAYLADISRGYIKPDAVNQYGDATLSKSESWTGKDSIRSQQDFLANKGVQDALQYAEFTANYSALTKNSGILPDDDICTAAGMLLVAHQFRSVAQAKEWRDKGVLVDEYKRGGDVYFNHGKNAIDVLSTQAINDSKSSPDSNTSRGATGKIAVVGDSIAEITGTALSKIVANVTVKATVGISTPTILSEKVPAATGYDVAVISASSNDLPIKSSLYKNADHRATVKKNLQQIRTGLKAKRYIWIIPTADVPKQLVLEVAAENKDQTVTFEGNPKDATQAYLHPLDPNKVAADVKKLL
jgi:hypothetical protein